MTNEQQPETAASIRDDTRTMLIATAEGLALATKRNAVLQERIDGLVDALRQAYSVMGKVVDAEYNLSPSAKQRARLDCRTWRDKHSALAAQGKQP